MLHGERVEKDLLSPAQVLSNIDVVVNPVSADHGVKVPKAIGVVPDGVVVGGVVRNFVL